MKKIINNPKLSLSILFVLFGIMLIDTIHFGANNIGEMKWWSLSAMIVFMLLFLIMIVKYFFLPFFNKIKK